MSVIAGDAVAAVRDMQDKDIAGECMKVLRELFKEQVMIWSCKTMGCFLREIESLCTPE